METMRTLSYLLLFSVFLFFSSTCATDAGLSEVVVRISADSTQAKLAIIDEMVTLGYGPDCPKSDRAYVDVKLPQERVITLQHMGFNLTIVEDPIIAEYERFAEGLKERTRGKRGIDEREDPFTSLYNKYHSQADISAFLDAIVTAYPQIARKYSIGKTVNDVDLFAIRITDNPDENEEGEVEFQYIANMHGDEVVGRELSLYFIYHLCSNYNQPRIKDIVDNTDIHILPTMNPDGFASGRRGNSRGRDLNRNFPDQFSATTWGGSVPLPPVSTGDGSFIAPSAGSYEPEVNAVMNWMGDHSFALAANFHGGSVVANYPFDGNRNRQSGRISQTPDDLLFKQLARTYAAHNGPMAASREFPSGITNGAEWYVLYGGMQDYSYLWHGTMHVTVELSDDKWPAPISLTKFWNDNRDSMLVYLEQARNRVWGVVTDCATHTPITTGYVIPAPSTCAAANCRMQAAKISKRTGEYHRLLPLTTGSASASYQVTASAPGYTSGSKTITVGPNTPLPLRLDFCLDKN